MIDTHRVDHVGVQKTWWKDLDSMESSGWRPDRFEIAVQTLRLQLGSELKLLGLNAVANSTSLWTSGGLLLP